ncbi:hypothetical protein [Streptomyces sp. NPDC127098]|uniref:hypothetical protein n=1 Tax=Streptomyces sp. NPDC127098 TaxID=3347137 RepID=UPI0036597E3E
MQIIITSRNAETLRTWRRFFENDPDVDLQVGNRAQVPVDAVLMAGIFAHERYGGSPSHDSAEILVNRRGDGQPPLVIVPPGRRMRLDEHGRPQVHPDHAAIDPAYHTASHVFDAIHQWNETRQETISAIEVSLPLVGFDDPLDESSPQAFRRALTEYRAKLR